MASRRFRARPAEANTTIELSELASGLAHAVLSAKVRLDEEAAAIAEAYKASSALSVLAPPAFAIGEATVTIRFAVAEVERPTSTRRGGKRSPARVHVHVSAASLAKMPPHLVSEIEFRIAPEPRRARPLKQGSDESE